MSAISFERYREIQLEVLRDMYIKDPFNVITCLKAEYLEALFDKYPELKELK